MRANEAKQQILVPAECVAGLQELFKLSVDWGTSGIEFVYHGKEVVRYIIKQEIDRKPGTLADNGQQA